MHSIQEMKLMTPAMERVLVPEFVDVIQGGEVPRDSCM